MSIHSQYLRAAGGAPVGPVLPIPPNGITIDITPPNFTPAEAAFTAPIDITAPNFTAAEIDFSDTIDITAPNFTGNDSDLTAPIALSYVVA